MWDMTAGPDQSCGYHENAHTWDTVALALGVPLIAIDLPGQGHSSRRTDRDYGPWRNAEAVAAVVRDAAPRATAVIGMSLGGVTAIRLAAGWPDLVRKLVVVDVTPQVSNQGMSKADRGAVALIDGPPPDARVEVVAGSGHAVQSDQPLEFARLVSEFLG